MQRLLFALAALLLSALMLLLVAEGFSLLMGGLKTGSPLVGWTTLAFTVLGLVALLWVRFRKRRQRARELQHQHPTPPAEPKE